MKQLSKMSSSVFLLAVLFWATNCKKDEPSAEANLVCGVTDPVRNLKWLNDEFRDFSGGPESNAIVLYEYEGKQVIEVQNSLYSSTNMHQYTCDGLKLDLQAPQAFTDFVAERKEIKVLYGTKIWR